MTQTTQPRHTVDTRTVLSVTLVQPDENGDDAAVDLTGQTVKFKLVNEDGAEVIAETEVGVTVVTAAEGKVNYDFNATPINTAGKYYAYFVVYDGTRSDHFPVNARDLAICVNGDV